ncbi:MAG: HAD family hydrolase [Elusimicrobia bacterium]|nr:HAD family hydrolase [Elusimicrobiota bacterium]
MKVVLFDLDGTLIRAGGAGRRALNLAVERLHGVKDACSEISLAGRTDLANFRSVLRGALGRPPTEAEARRIEEAYLERLPAEVRSAVRRKAYELVPGVARLLKALGRKSGVLLGLGTGNVRPGALIKLRPSGLLRHFPFGGFGCDGYTRVSLLRAAVRRAAALSGSRIRPERVFVIGDTEKDVRAGKAAGYRTGAVTAGFGAAAAIREARPELIAPDFRDPRPWLRWIDGRPSGSSSRSPA